ncbi:2-C-methyl-D-erythritol 2,4-cyclodiphosphate synthase [Thermodesulforhabdus norvegica]|uniref:2-C-methyl-D-erythritol 2,4-cyclodiphosphate synthase n=1 Tax=Thermodesulforhabdus norvegica TaxID=39841 RepID=A0A1I4V1Y7_9BACT|nr:2-C-methyl-D-erythritol 2,4-cyclodiphosphate synthase [Thermodesulforhabdus norvegica]SFM95113.1 2-C-methyl-D-erythritol 2,4-cyclodiphosphate synthase [Thermodesulforhabdus norvegica]
MENGALRVGFGYDVHAFAEGRRLILGGIEIPYELGLAGHSDADVVIHSICDALLGAAALGDIGRHFPDTDPAYRGISSLILLRRVKDLLKEHGFVVSNVDVTIVAQKPRLAPYVDLMVRRICDELGWRRGLLNIKATTTEGLGFAGRGEGIASYAIALIMKIQEKNP